ncbi:protein SSX4 [Kogia breviceps]|uniref:protein SSX4 n=1 Tax=Kogia breviceps TaxID=27615 RepID=UPI00279573C1|nr:protein SSX4 [Kogia breviceps]
MNRGSSFAKSPREDSQKPEKNSKAFKDISKYFSKKEWADLGYSEKITYVYMKRNYDTMTDLGLKTTLPTFMCPKKRATKSSGHDSKGRNPRNQYEPAQEASNMQERKHLKVMPKKSEKKKYPSKSVPKTSGSEQAQEQLCPLGKEDTSDQQSMETSGPRRRKIDDWTHSLQEKKNLVVYEEICDPKEDD